MGTFYSKDGPITTEKDYDVVKRVPEGQVVYNYKFPNLVYYENQVLPMRNGVIVNHQDSDWVMESYESYAKKHNIHTSPQTQINSEEKEQQNLEYQNKVQLAQELLESVKKQRDVEIFFENHDQFQNKDVKELGKKYGLQITSLGEFSLNPFIKLDEIKNLTTLMLRYFYYLSTGNKNVFKGEIDLESIKKEVDSKDYPLILFRAVLPGLKLEDQGRFSEAFIYFMYDPNLVFDENDVKFAEIIFKKAKEYFLRTKKQYFPILVDPKDLPQETEEKEDVLKWAPFYLMRSISNISVPDVNFSILAIPQAILGESWFSILKPKLDILKNIINEFFNANKLNNLSEDAARSYLENGFDINLTLIDIYEILSERLKTKLESTIYSDISTEDIENYKELKYLLAMGNFYIGYVLLKAFNKYNDLKELKEQDFNSLHIFFYKVLSKISESDDFETDLIRMFFDKSDTYKSIANVFAYILYSNALDDRQKVEEYLKKKNQVTKPVEISFDKFFTNLNYLFNFIFDNWSVENVIKSELQELFLRKGVQTNASTFLSLLPFILENFNNGFFAYSFDKDLLKEAINTILDIVSKSSPTQIFDPNLKAQLFYLIEKSGEIKKDSLVSDYYKQILDIILNTSPQKAQEDSSKINLILRSVLKEINKIKNDLINKTYLKSGVENLENYAEFLSETIKMFEDMYHPQNTTDITYMEMKQNLDLLGIKKDLYETLTELENFDYSLSQALKETLIQRKDLLLFKSCFKLRISSFSDLSNAEKKFKEFLIKNINDAIVSIANSIKAINSISFKEYEGELGELLEEKKKTLLSYLNYILDYLDSEHVTESHYKLNLAIYKSLSLLKDIYQFSSNEDVRKLLSIIGANILDAKYKLADVLNENKYNTKVVIPISSGSSSNLISGHILFMNLIKDIDEYKDFAKTLILKKLKEREKTQKNNEVDKNVRLLTIAKLSQERESLLEISLDENNNILIGVPIRSELPYMGQSDAHTPSNLVVERITMFDLLKDKNTEQLGDLYKQIYIPKRIIVAKQKIALEKLKKIIFSKETKELDEFSDEEYLISNAPSIISHEKFLGIIKPTNDIFTVKSLKSLGAIDRHLSYVKRRVSNFVNTFKQQKDTLINKERLDNYRKFIENDFSNYNFGNFSKEAFDTLVDAEEEINKTLGRITSAYYVTETLNPESLTYKIVLVSEDKDGNRRDFNVFLSSLSLESFKRLTNNFFKELMKDYLDIKEKLLSQNLSKEERKNLEDMLLEAEQKIYEFESFLNSIKRDLYATSSGILSSIFSEISNFPKIKTKFIESLAKQALLEASLGISATYISNEDTLSIAPYVGDKDTNTQSATNDLALNLYGFPVYMNKLTSPRFMYRMTKLIKSFIERTTRNNYLVDVAKYISDHGHIKYVSGFYRAYHKNGYIVLDLFKFFKSKVFDYVYKDKGYNLFELVDKILDSGLLEDFDRIYPIIDEARFFHKIDDVFTKLNQDYLNVLIDIQRRLSEIVGKDLSLYETIEFMTEFNRSFKSTIFHELGHYLDFSFAAIPVRQPAYQIIRRVLRNALSVIKYRLSKRTDISDSFKERISNVIEKYESENLYSANASTQNIYQYYYEFLNSISDKVSYDDIEKLLQIILKAQEDGYVLHIYALFNEVEVPSMTLEYLASLGEEEFKRRFFHYKQIVDYLKKTMEYLMGKNI